MRTAGRRGVEARTYLGIPLAASGELVEGDIGAQTDQVLHNLAAVLQAAGGSLSNVVKTTVFLADMGDFAGMNEVYARHFGDHRRRATSGTGLFAYRTHTGYL